MLKINIEQIECIVMYVHNKWTSLMVKVLTFIHGVQGSNLTKYVVVVNDGILTKYSPRLHRLTMWLIYLSF